MWHEDTKRNGHNSKEYSKEYRKNPEEELGSEQSGLGEGLLELREFLSLHV